MSFCTTKFYTTKLCTTKSAGRLNEGKFCLKQPARRRALSWLEGLATLQATGLVAGGDQAAKWAHPLRGEIAVLWFHSR
jgi:hypothetical protein